MSFLATTEFKTWAGEMNQRLRAIAAFVGTKSLFESQHPEQSAHNRLSTRGLVPFSGICEHSKHVHEQVHAQTII